MTSTENRLIEERKQGIREWKKSYLEALVDKLQPFGDVLQIGFDLGFAAERIQSFRPKNHTIIEADAKIAEEAKKWASKHSNVTIIQNDWKKALSKLGTFDAIFFDDYALDDEMELMKRVSPDVLSQTSSQVKDLLKTLEEQLSKTKANFSDQEIAEFLKKVDKKYLQKLPRFFKKLKEKKHITEEQYKNTVKKYHLAEEQTELQPKGFAQSTVLEFLEKGLKHLRKGGRFSCVFSDLTSKYEDSAFFEKIITNPELEFQEQLVTFNVPNFSKYYKADAGLITLIEKMV